MGYMGLGLQSWIYRMRPRKPYSMQRKGSFSELPTYRREFKIQASKQQSRINVYLSALLIFFVIGVFALFAPRFSRHRNKINLEARERLVKLDDAAYEFLLTSGKSRLLSNNIMGAYTEFNLAYSIKPRDEEITTLFIETLSILCVDDNTYCDQLNNIQENYNYSHFTN